VQNKLQQNASKKLDLSVVGEDDAGDELDEEEGARPEVDDEQKLGKSEKKVKRSSNKKDSGRPRKRRKLDQDPTVDETAPPKETSRANSPTSSHSTSTIVDTNEKRHDESETHESNAAAGVLHYFPQPTRPQAPAKTELASLGLDRALAHAQLVDSTRSVILSEEDNDGMNLSLKTRARLKDLGVTELFAGELPLQHATCLTCNDSLTNIQR
jgi:ATP-dependent RNA helicase DDX51/DBP6